MNAGFETPVLWGEVEFAGRAQIRRCERGDLRTLEWFGLFTPHRRIIREAFERQQRGETLMLVLDWRGAPIGQVWLELPRARGDAIGSVWALRVFPWFQRLGLGTRLILAAERALHEHGAARVELNVDRDNAEGLRFYQRLGYAVVGEYVNTFNYRSPSGLHRTVQLDQWVLGKPLRPAVLSQRNGARRADPEGQ